MHQFLRHLSSVFDAVLQSSKHFGRTNKWHSIQFIKGVAAQRLGTQCQMASGEWNPGNSTDHQYDFHSVGIGMMIPKPTARVLKFLHCASNTWMLAAGPSLTVLLLADCTIDSSFPHLKFLDSPKLPMIHTKCFSGQIQINIDDFGKTAALHEEMLRMMGSKDFFLKLDLDAMVIPANLFSFISMLQVEMGSDGFAYFGSDEISTRNSSMSAMLRTFKGMGVCYQVTGPSGQICER
tara:strand:+ start:869 stop:1576 length:708 start_codon:yes stop_codon:yes gene_type:complete